MRVVALVYAQVARLDHPIAHGVASGMAEDNLVFELIHHGIFSVMLT
jgi:hypothetical protein